MLTGGGGADTLTGGGGADTLTGGLDSDMFVFTAGDIAPSLTYFDFIADYEGADSIRFGNTLSLASNNGSSPTQSHAQIVAGKANFDASDTTLTSKLNAIVAEIGQVSGSIVLFGGASGDNTNSYLFISDATAGLSAGDVLIKLQGVFTTIAVNGNSATLG
jgi:Ca2+-binding RTX toxin-like protein